MSLGYRLSDADKRVIKAFTSGKAAESKNLTSTGHQLDSNWLGGRGLGRWHDDRVFLRAPQGNIDQTIYNFAKKSTPSKVFGGYISEIRSNPSVVYEIHEHGNRDGWRVVVKSGKSVQEEKHFTALAAAKKWANGQARRYGGAVELFGRAGWATPSGSLPGHRNPAKPTTFKDVLTGEHFQFATASEFTDLCTKTGARTYQWRTNHGFLVKSRIGPGGMDLKVTIQGRAVQNPTKKAAKSSAAKPMRFLVGKKLGAYTHACTTRQEALATAKATGAKVFVAELLQESDLEHLSMGRRVQNPHCNPAEPADEHAETELELWVANDAKFHRMALACAAVVEKHRAKGRFDASKAPLAYSKLVDTAAKSYAREFDDASRWNQLFSAATRRNVCASLADIFATRYREGVR